ncbi:type I-E CRISPR-associated protein Cse1/CasA [uncultured Paracoccus sp.]|uniref:type I-E CRISPR-associated protein Cse1/CasA n=1 Tax=uncultured Paracoccus sp. TaxID=189685 RepID=UPI002629B3BA|nr:type I-E CRISPR-associated protein Cse1/CasA [uncultured Paracoccus sp.]
MTLNLISDPWIAVRRSDDGPSVIRPDQIAEPGVIFPRWPRADLNIACLELLIGLVFLADPPADAFDWRSRKPDAQRLRERLAPLAPAFDLMGDGPRFLQDFDLLKGDPNPPDMLFIDSAGGNAARNNADLMVRRNRYPALELPLAAMALYTLQAHAPAGGAGNRTSMRGGGPMVTLVDPGQGNLWDLVWANVPDGRSAGPEVLPWMRPTRTSEAKGSEVYPETAHPAEAFFGMPRRLQLRGGAQVTGVIQKPNGANYAGWEHPLTPYYRQKAGSELLPMHPRAGAFGYRNWLGVVMDMPGDEGDLRRRAKTLDGYERRVLSRDRACATVIVAGWAMDNMKPRDFTWSRQPLLSIGDEAGLTLIAFIQSAESYGLALRGALKVVAGEGSALDALREEFFITTQASFEEGVGDLLVGTPASDTAARWLRAMEATALGIFDREALPGLDEERPEVMQEIIMARERLRAAFAGWSKLGKEAYLKLGLQPRVRKKEAA